MRDEYREAPTRRGRRILGWIAALGVFAGVGALAWCALVIADGYRSQRAARHALETASQVDIAPPRADREAAGRPRLVPGEPLAALSIPRLHLSAVVLHGSDSRTLRRGLGHVEGTAVPGEAGNVAIAGHRDSFFRPLQNVRIGDDVLLDTPREHLHYRVSDLRVVRSDGVKVLEPTPDAVLTLITCYPFGLLGHAPDRFIVRATRVADPQAATVAMSEAREDRDTASPLEAVSARAEAHANLGETGTIPAYSARSESQGRALPDDEMLVRQTVEHFRQAYNVRLARRSEVRPDGPLTLLPCDVVLDGDRGTATCGSESAFPTSLEPSTWIFRVEKESGGWALASIARQ